MFFSISDIKDNRFFNHFEHCGVVLSTDSGWEELTHHGFKVFFKGYCDQYPMKDVARAHCEDILPKYSGNFCIILLKEGSAFITHDTSRGFPLKYYSSCNVITNLLFNHLVPEHIWSDSYISYSSIYGINKKYFDPYAFELSPVTYDDGIDAIASRLTDKIHGLTTLPKPIKTFLSGGVDTMKVYALLTSYLPSDQIELIAEEHFESTKFTLLSLEPHEKHMWAYKQIHHWRSPTVIATGGSGDEIFLRGPTTAAIWCAWNNINLIEELSKSEYYHTQYYLKEANKKIISQFWRKREILRSNCPTYHDLCNKILSIVGNDHQHWHLENTLTWTPLKDLEFLRIILNMPFQNILSQILDGEICKKIITKLDPELIKYVCPSKNAPQQKFNHLLNYRKYLDILQSDM